MILPALLLATLTPQFDASVAPEPLFVAITEKGLKVQCTGQARPGDREFETPFGMYRDPLDPVAQVVDSARVADRLRKLRETPEGWPSWMQQVSDEGLLEELVAGADELLDEAPGHLAMFQLLERWGSLLDPVPERVSMDKRVEYMWRLVHDPSPAVGTLAAGCLATKVPNVRGSSFDRIVSIAEVQKGLKHKWPHVRRAAARIGGNELLFDLLSMFLRVSVEDSQHAVRDAAAFASSAVHEHDARQFWTLSLARGKKVHRLQAAENLGRYAGSLALHSLVHVLAAHDRNRPGHFKFGDRQLQVVREVSQTHMTGGLDGGTYDQEVVSQGSTFKVTIYDDEVTQAILAALTELSGGQTQRTAQEWLVHYLEEAKPTAN